MTEQSQPAETPPGGDPAAPGAALPRHGRQSPPEQAQAQPASPAEPLPRRDTTGPLPRFPRPEGTAPRPAPGGAPWASARELAERFGRSVRNGNAGSNGSASHSEPGPVPGDQPLLPRRDDQPLPWRDEQPLLPRRDDQPLPWRSEQPLPRRGEQAGPVPGDQPLPRRDDQPLPWRSEQPLPRRGEQAGPVPGDQPLPRRDDQPLPRRGEQPLPRRGEPLPPPAASEPEPLPRRGGASGPAPSGPAAGGPPGTGPALPRRTTRTRPAGRHRSPHRLSVASDAPALVLAVPGTAQADTQDLGAQIAEAAGQSCPGVDIRVGYLDGSDFTLADSLQPTADPDSGREFPSVVVPLLLGPDPRLDPAIRQAVAGKPGQAIVAEHLGPHPLVAEALHTRLAEAGLARQTRSSGLSINADFRGIVVLAGPGEEAMNGASIAAVLLASRLSVPVMPASLGDPSSIVTAVERLSESSPQRPVLAPCLIGPETSLEVLADLSEALDAPCAPVLGAHQAVGQLVAVRYGAALTSLSVTS